MLSRVWHERYQRASRSSARGAIGQYGLIGLTWLAGLSCGGVAHREPSGSGGATASAGTAASTPRGGSGGVIGDAGSAPTNAGASSEEAVAGGGGGNCLQLELEPPATCHSDADCQGFCAPEGCGPALVCVNGVWVSGGPVECPAECEMWPAGCGGTQELDAQLTQQVCVAVLAIDGSSGAISQFMLDCGEPKVTTASEALASLLPMSSVNWGGADPIGVVGSSRLYAFQVGSSAERHTAYVSADTGHLLLIVDRPGSGAPGTVRSSLTSRAAGELGMFCEPAATTLPVALDPSESVDLARATESILATGLLQALKRNFRIVGPLLVTAVDAAPSQFLVFVTATGPAVPK